MTSNVEIDDAEIVREDSELEAEGNEALDALPELEEGAYLASYDKQPCSAAKMETLRTKVGGTERIDCHVSLQAGDVIKTKLLFEGAASSGVVFDCGGAFIDGNISGGPDNIEIRSRKFDGGWERVEDVTLRGCNIRGAIRVWGMGKNGEAPDVRESSRQEGHVERVRGNAPRRILLEGLTLEGTGRTPLYLGPGTSYVTLQDSEITGEATSAGVYFCAETWRNTVARNYLHVTSRKEYVGGVYTRKREELALDGSSENLIVGNLFSTLEGGGIFLYRNCGEGGTIRWTPPQKNQIINNVFYYNKYDGDEPAVYLGSRDNDFWEFRAYCNDEDGYPWGSSADNRSFARNNVVMQNQIYKLSVRDMIKTGDSSNSGNIVERNETVNTEIDRPSGCYVQQGYKSFLLSGESLDVYKTSAGAPYCGYKTSCQDGFVTRTASACALKTVDFGCQVGGDNAGCSGSAVCPSGTFAVAAKAACNLEFGAVTDALLSGVKVGSVDVVRSSDNKGDGRCQLGDTAISSDRKAVAGVVDRQRTTFSCKEKDKNGGDCHVRGALICR